MFPIPAEELDRQRVLLIGLVAEEPTEAYFVAGVASWSGSQLRICYDPTAPSIEPTGTPRTWSGFNPAVLPQLLFPKAWRLVEPIARDVAACVVAWVAEPIPSVLRIADPFFGLAGNERTGEIFLMRGDPSLVEFLSRTPDVDRAAEIVDSNSHTRTEPNP